MKQVLSIYIILAALIVSGIQLTASAQRKFGGFSIDQGLSASNVRSIVQDPDGFIWFATNNGLNRYDGQTFKIYTGSAGIPGSLSHNEILDLHVDRQGRLWVYTQLCNLDAYDPETDTFRHYPWKKEGTTPPRWAKLGVPRLSEDADGNLWAPSVNGRLAKFNTKTKTYTFFDRTTGSPFQHVKGPLDCLFIDEEGVIWLGSRLGELVKYTPGKKNAEIFRYDYPGFSGNRRPPVMYIYQKRPGQLYLSLFNFGLLQFDVKTNSFSLCRPPDHLPPGAFKTIISIDHTKAGDTWFQTSDIGIILLEKKTQEYLHFQSHPAKPYSLTGNFITAFYEDRTGIIWLGTLSSGVNFFSPNSNRFSHYKDFAPEAMKRGRNMVFGFYEDRNGLIWIAANGAGLYSWNPATGNYTGYSCIPGDPHSLSSNMVYSLTGDRQGRIWAGTSMGLNALNTKTRTFTRYLPSPNNENGLSNGTVNCLLEDHAGHLWIGTYNGLNRLDKDTGNIVRCQPPHVPYRITHPEIANLYEDKNKNLWISTRGGGLNKLDRKRETITIYRHTPGKNSISHNHTLSILEDRNGAMWFGTPSGINRFNPATGEFKCFTAADGLPNNFINGILEDEQGRLWISTDRGVSCFMPSNGSFKNYGPWDGLQAYEFVAPAYFKDSKNRLYFGGLNGYNVFSPGEIVPNHHVPPVVFTDFKLFNQSVPIGGQSPLKNAITKTREIRLTHKDSTFSFHFAALDFTRPERNLFMYKLEGVHRDWVHLRHKRDITFTGLEPGEYLLQIRGANSEGVWNNEGAAIKIIITPPFWKTHWFRGLVLLFIAGIFLIWHRMRMKFLTVKLDRQAKLERIIEKYNISKREKEIILLIVEGKTNKNIEDTLFISENTVKTHIYNIYKKAGVNSRLELINLLQNTG